MKTISFPCGHEGCKERGNWMCKSLKEQNEIYQQYGNGKYKCVRHTEPNKVLSLENNKIVTILTAEKSKKYPDLEGLYWNDGCGFVFGNGYKAYASDFTEGTKLVITAEIYNIKE